ncbi:HAD family hydrolase [Nocardia sp. NPDC057440]|uniref:HAD family hydrolase n=1 Tax=Nocardia sp. NPDC057440 TaxID=3346134 RepID=UPI00366F7468
MNAVGGATPNLGLVLLDLDGTLIDHRYQLATDSIYAAIEAAQAAGWTIGLNSDTPYEALCVWVTRLGITGPIVAENGAVIGVDGHLWYDHETADKFAESRRVILGGLLGDDIGVWSGNPVEAIRNGEVTIPAEMPLVMVNTLRRCSLSLHIRRGSRDGLLLDTDLTEVIADRVASAYPDFSDLIVDKNHDYGVIIVQRAGFTKRLGVQRLMEKIDAPRVIMIGNSISDYLGDDLAMHIAVADATEALKQRADRVTEAPLTGGVSEALHQLCAEQASA